MAFPAGLIALFLSIVAGIGTFIGGYSITRSAGASASSIPRLQAFSAGVMIFMCIFDIIPEASEHISRSFLSFCFFFGMFVMGLIERYTPENWFPDLNSGADSVLSATHKPLNLDQSLVGSSSSRINLKSTWMTWVAMAIHNAPEGVAIYMSTLKNSSFGLALAFTITCHNIPEGMAVAIPIYSATKNTFLTAKYTILNALCEPAAVLLCCLIFGFDSREARISGDNGSVILSSILATVSGIMVFVALFDLYPASFQVDSTGNSYQNAKSASSSVVSWDKRKRRAILDLISGMILGAAILWMSDLIYY